MKSPETQKQHYIVIEGNVGSGKSTFLRLIKNYFDAQVVFEPHQQWQHEDSEQNLLNKFYTDTQRWAYTFQTYAFVTRIITQEQHTQKNPYTMQFLERSVFSDRYCFAKNAHEQGYMNILEWKLYTEWFSWLVDGYVPKPSAFIYLQVDPTVCFKRLQKRDRVEEASVTLEYLEQLHDKHEQWLLKKEGVADYLYDVPVLTLAADDEFEAERDVFERYVAQIAIFLNSIPRIQKEQNVLSLSL
jgi:deoxyadenosine/deoxycytidine kinase